MAVIDFRTIPRARIDQVSDIMRTEFQDQFKRVRGTATGDTLKSITVKVKVTQQLVEWSVFAGPGYIWAVRGKRANTKLPVIRTGSGWELVEPLKRWHQIKTPGMPEFLLARAIARKARAPIPLTERADKRLQPQIQPLLLNSGIDKTILTSLIRV